MSRGRLILLLFMGALLGAHLAIGLCAARLMVGRDAFARFPLVLGFVLLPFTFRVAWAWNRRRPGIGPSILHVCHSLWLAFVIHLVMALAIAFLFGAVAAAAGRTPGVESLIRTAAALALALTALGFVNARYPRVKNVSIPVRDLPAAWADRTLVHLSDVHLGPIQGRRFLRRLVKKVNRLDPDVIVITGDLFDIFVRDPERFAAGLARFRSRHGVYFVIGNIEVHVGVDKVLQALSRSGILVLDGRVVDIDGLQFLGVGYPAKHSREEQSDPFGPNGGYRRDVPCVLLYHTPTGVDGPREDLSTRHLNALFSPRTDFSFAREAGVDVQLSGHTHGGQTFPFMLLTRRLFGKFAGGLHRMGDFSVYVSAGTGTWGPPVRLGTTPEIAVIRLVCSSRAPRSFSVRTVCGVSP
ncbi:MAG: metallophosphoesterase [Kiritimatiellae bacterium]|nr:metallophosphoesterase [Kiritimatiellia bacterium]